MEHTGAAATPLRALPFPPRVTGDVPDDAAVEQIAALFRSYGPGALHLQRVKFLSSDLAAVRLHAIAWAPQPVEGVVRRVEGEWTIEPATRDMLLRVVGEEIESTGDVGVGGDDDDAA
jgi:hypothetical protein